MMSTNIVQESIYEMHENQSMKTHPSAPQPMTKILPRPWPHDLAPPRPPFFSFFSFF